MNDAHSPGGRTLSVFIPVFLTVIAIGLWFGYRTVQLFQERADLTVLSTNQEAVYANARKMRAQLEAIAGGTARLAGQGNVNALNLVAALKAKGVNLRVPERSRETSSGAL